MKKATSLLYEHTLGIIIMVVIAIVILIFIMNIGKETKRVALEEGDCEKQVIAHVQTIKATQGRFAPEIECPTIKKTVTEKDETKIELALAENMRECWKTWQQGKEELFVGEGTYCHICYLVDFKNKGIEINDFDQFLIETNIPGQKYKYIQYLTGFMSDDFNAEEAAAKAQNAQMTSYSTDSELAVLFYYIKGADAQFLHSELGHYTATTGGALVGGVVGGVIGAGAFGAICGFFTLGIGAAPCATVGGVLGKIIGATVGGGIGALTTGPEFASNPWYSMILLKPYDKETLEKLGCQIAPTKQRN